MVNICPIRIKSFAKNFYPLLKVSKCFKILSEIYSIYIFNHLRYLIKKYNNNKIINNLFLYSIDKLYKITLYTKNNIKNVNYRK